jgi:glutamate 5-kinase
MKIVVKVGTQSVLAENGKPFKLLIQSIVKQLAELQAEGHHIVLVSSGAVGMGRWIAKLKLGKKYGTSIGEKQVLASLGQHELMHIYSQMFKKHNLLVAQLLLTKHDFHTRQHYINI